MANKDELKLYTIAELLHSGDYVIPVYQRNYSWGEAEIHQFVQDIYDYSKDKAKCKKHYFIGTLIVFVRKNENHYVYETIDGQQRFTTISIIISVLRRQFSNCIYFKNFEYDLNLYFDCREKSTNTLQIITDISSEINYSPNQKYSPSIQQGYRDAEKIILKLLENTEVAEKFIEFFLNKVKIVRVSVPEDTDLNHYFEIMNNRGEQLEKHEILKSYMLNIIRHDKKSMYAFNKIWEACSDMERYLQYGFPVETRGRIFGNKWDYVEVRNFNAIRRIMSEYIKEDNDRSELIKPKSITNILDTNSTYIISETEEIAAPERFNTIVSFPNFLLHVLRVQEETDIPLDDKRLIDVFTPFLSDKENDLENFVKSFSYNLLKCKYILDSYIIKREYVSGKEQWSLKYLKMVQRNRRKDVSYLNTFDDEWNDWFIKILSMFHVSFPTPVYKHWLNACLYFAFYRDDFYDIPEETYFEYLYHLAEAFLYDRILKLPDKQLDYFQIIYKNKGKRKNENLDIDYALLDRGTSVENFAFNYLDFKLWTKDFKDSDTFDFSFKSSVEHYYPRRPIAQNEKIEPKYYDNFGNLCLLTSEKNSRLNNHMPKAKMDYYEKVGADSLKQRDMMEVTKEKEDWNPDIIIEEGVKMKKLLLSDVDWL